MQRSQWEQIFLAILLVSAATSGAEKYALFILGVPDLVWGVCHLNIFDELLLLDYIRFQSLSSHIGHSAPAQVGSPRT